MSFIYGVLLTHNNLRLHDDFYDLVEHNETENVAVQYRTTDKAEELVEQMSNIELESNGPVPASPPILGPPSGISTDTSTTPKRRMRHAMSMIGSEPTVPNPSMPNGKAMTTPSPRRGTYTSSTLIYITSCFGASCLGMPWCFAQCGWALALILLILTALTTQWGAGLLLQCAVTVSGEPSGGVSIKQVAIIASPTLAALPELVVIINCLGSAISALVVSGFLLPRTFRSLDSLREKFHRDLVAAIEWKNLLRERVLWISIITACVLPLCFLRDITPLKYTGLVSLVAVTFATVVMASAYFSPSFFDTCEVMGRTPCATDVVAFRLDNVTGVLVRINGGGITSFRPCMLPLSQDASMVMSSTNLSRTSGTKSIALCKQCNAVLTLAPLFPPHLYHSPGVHSRVFLQLLLQLPAAHRAQCPGQKVDQD